MDAADAITYLAHAEAMRIRPVTDDEEMAEYAERGKALPYFTVRRDGMGRLTASGSGHAGHDNEERMPFMVDFLNRRVLPMVDPAANVKGHYRIELHDSYSYLPNSGEYENALSFCRPRGATESVALLPDPYHIAGFGGLLSVRDSTPWDQKRSRMFFAGTTTGDRDPARNARIRACVWSLDHRDISEFYITNVAQMTAEHAAAAVPRFRETLRPPVPPDAHFRFRFQVNIVGNTACWSRVPMIMSSRCLMLHVRHADAMWYYPALQEGTHYVGVDGCDDLARVYAQCRGSDAWCQSVVANANRFAEAFFAPRRPESYAAQLLEAAAHRSRA